MEPKHEGLEDDVPSELGDFWVTCKSSGVYWTMLMVQKIQQLMEWQFFFWYQRNRISEASTVVSSSSNNSWFR